jgi:hypothetical protein
LSGGEELYADVIVGADGYTSLLQDIVAGPSEFRAPQLKNAPSKSLIITHTVPAHLLEADPDLRPLVADPSIVSILSFQTDRFVHLMIQWSTWLGHRYIAHANSLVGSMQVKSTQRTLTFFFASEFEPRSSLHSHSGT